jgi:flagellar basal body-associated protein FliL
VSAKTPPPAAAPAEGAEAAAPAKKGGFMKLAIIGVVVLLGLGAGGWFLAPKLLGHAPAKADAKPAPVVVKATVALEPVVVNLSGETRRYVRVGISLGVPAAKDVKEVEESKAQLLDLLIGVVTSQKPEQLVSSEGREAIKHVLLERIHEELKLEKVARVYFTEFVIQ